MVEAQGYKSAVLVADELMGLLDGSKLKDKGAVADQLAPFTALPQVPLAGCLKGLFRI